MSIWCEILESVIFACNKIARIDNLHLKLCSIRFIVFHIIEIINYGEIYQINFNLYSKKGKIK